MIDYLVRVIWNIRATGRFLFNQTVRPWADAKQQGAALCSDLCQQVNDGPGRFILGMRIPAPVLGERDAAFPRVIQLRGGNLLLRSLVVLVPAAGGS